MRAFNALSSLAVMACVLIISFVHSLELFRTYGFTGYLAYLGVIAVELTFVSSMLNIIVCRLKERPAGLPSYIGGLLGVSLVAWSNVSATAAYGWPGVVLGLFVPAALIVSESIMSYAVLRAARVQERGVQDVQDVQRDKVQTGADVQLHSEQLNAQPQGEQDVQAEAEQSAQSEQASSVQRRVVQIEQRRSERRTTNNVQRDNVQRASREQLNDVQSGVQPDRDDSEMYRKVEQVALELYRETGRFPGRPKLKELTGYTDRQLMPIVRELKKKYAG